jgi:hypothetical protein
MSADPHSVSDRAVKGHAKAPVVSRPADSPERRRLPLAPLLFFLGLGALLLSWFGFMGYYVLVKARQPKPVPEVWAPAANSTNPPAPPAGRGRPD